MDAAIGDTALGMTVDAKMLYQRLVLDHSKNPTHEGMLEPRTHEARGINPLCGDRVTIHVYVDETGRLVDIRFMAQGCAIAKASASMMSELVKGGTTADALALHDEVERFLQPHGAGPEEGHPLASFANVRHFPSRIRCATLAWETLRKALASHKVQRVATD
ncbi:MAG: Fe-S cluster assembly sulfur transfer protein SufU [Myxococcota bacterium]